MSIASDGRPPVRWRSSSKTSSITWVSSAIAAKPIVALMPFSECAIRKIPSTVVLVLRGLLELDDGEVQFLEVLPRLGEEHRHVFGGVHQLSGR